MRVGRPIFLAFVGRRERSNWKQAQEPNQTNANKMQSGSDYDEDDVEHNSRPSRVSSRVLTRTRSNPPPRLNSRPSRVGRSSSRQDSIDFEGEVEGDGDGAEEDQDEDQEEGEIEEAEDDEEPAEIGSDIDAINSGAVTPALGGTSSSAPGGVKKGKHPQFLARKKETKVCPSASSWIKRTELDSP